MTFLFICLLFCLPQLCVVQSRANFGQSALLHNEDQKFLPLEKQVRLFQCFALIILKLCVFLHKVAWDWQNVGGRDKKSFKNRFSHSGIVLRPRLRPDFEKRPAEATCLDEPWLSISSNILANSNRFMWS